MTEVFYEMTVLALLIVRVTTCLENLEMSPNLKEGREKSGKM